MIGGPRIDEVARLVGDPSRATMLDVLMDGRAWTGRELARAAHVTASTASEHLQRLVNGDLLSVVQQGRFRYYRIASREVAYALEAFMVLVPREPAGAPIRAAIDPGNARRPLCRACMDWSERRLHLAGRAGAALARHALERGWIQRQTGTRAVVITARGVAALRDHFELRIV